MMSSKTHITVLVGASALFLGSVDAHGWMSLPAVTFPNNVDKTQFIASIQSSASGFSGSFGGSPSDNAAAFWKGFKSSKYSSLKEFVTELAQIGVDGATIECGLTDPNETPQPLPNEIEWTHSESEGFTLSHEGPCEAYCDNTLVFQDKNCPANFPAVPAKLPYDKAACAGASRLTFYWLALHSPSWQVYINCAALEGGSGVSSPSSSNSTYFGSTEQSDTPTIATTPTTSPATPTTSSVTPATAPVSSTTIADTPKTSANTPTTSPDTPKTSPVAPDTATTSANTPTTAPVSSTFDAIAPTTVNSADQEDEECGSLDIAGGEEDCDLLDIAGNSVEQTAIRSESSLNFDNIDDGSYVSGKVEAAY
ncbi:unnamed protein product [Peronospora belbahrii]|uniref:Uncharacterized protein n=1 Tax=Peronospora belbahrii TaxID=622444 RepID=A0AAU9KUG8_9STRA|nr:unnamed protein product [Peronospora belbahrii]